MSLSPVVSENKKFCELWSWPSRNLEFSGQRMLVEKAKLKKPH